MARLVTLLLLAAALAPAQARIAARSGFDPAEAVLGETVAYIVEIDVQSTEEIGAVPRPELPVVEGVTFTFTSSRPSTGMSRTVRGGRITTVFTHREQFVFSVKPDELGTLRVPGFRYRSDHGEADVPAATLRVGKEAPGNKHVTIKVTSEPENPYVNQPVKLRFELVSEKIILSRSVELDVPWAGAPNGFYAPPRPTPARRPLIDRGKMVVMMNGQQIALDLRRNRQHPERNTLVFERELYPIAPGRVEIPGSSVAMEVATKLGRGTFGDMVARETAKAVVRSAAIPLTVRDAPLAGRPASYTGIIGDFAVTASYGKTKIRAGDGVTLKLTVTGKGDVEGIKPPELDGFEAFDIYPPDRSVETNRDEKTVTMSWLLVPSSPEVKEVPRFELAWFKPSTEVFETVSAGPAALEIVGDARDEGIFGGATGGAGTDVRTIAEGIRPLKRRPGTFTSGAPGASLGLVLAVLIVPVLSLVGLTVMDRRRRRLAGDESLVRQKRASKEATARLAEARSLLDEGGRDFYGKLTRCLTGFIGDKIGVPAASVSAATAAELLSNAGVPSADVAQIAKILTALDDKQYGMSETTPAERQESFEAVESAVRLVDRGVSR